MTRISAAKIIRIHNKLIKSQSPHIKSNSLQRPTLSATWYLLFLWLSLWRIAYRSSFVFVSRNAAFFTNVSLAKSVSAMWFKDRPHFLCIITLLLSEITNYFVIITERFYLIQRLEDRTSPWNWHETNTTIVMDTFDWRQPKLSFWNGKKSLKGACDW